LGQELGDTEGWHASVKPVAVIIDLVQRVGGLVYEPFLGSGTTLIACEKLGRRARCIEIEPGYVAVALERWATMTGLEPVLLSSNNFTTNDG
jgi:DNA modification methylase